MQSITSPASKNVDDLQGLSPFSLSAILFL
uniref:Uncharacterized protein n=1 Tax=Rhizophora mucronata TaxID=61149 RepID=A0A2P2N2M8_RHIMU